MARETIVLDHPWKFFPGDMAEASEIAHETSAWQQIALPHDWSIGQPTDKQEPSAGGGGFFPTGVGWYRKEFDVPSDWKDRHLVIEFEGVAGNTEVWLNGTRLGEHPYAYTPFRFDVTPHVRLGETNVLAVRVDNSRQPNSRWYSGSGIYRLVHLHMIDPLHVDCTRLFIKTDTATAENADVSMEIPLANKSGQAEVIRVQSEIVDPAGNVVATAKKQLRVEPQQTSSITQQFSFDQPALWSPEAPELYAARIAVYRGEETVDEVTENFGVRTIEVNSETGLLLNGEPITLFGANIHHDNGPLGAAAFAEAEARRVRILKAAGFNAIRTAHNPPSTAFLDACDQFGMLVVDEAFDGWASKKTEFDYGTVFHDWWRRDLEAMVVRDRNHPSVIMWSIGNEVYERGKESGLRIAQEMTEVVKQLDSTRPVTAGLNGLGSPEKWPELDRLFAVLDVAGYNYELARHEEDHRRVPERVIMSSESYPTDTFQSWYAVEHFPYVIGDFVWSGMDYLGEAGIGRVFKPGEKVLPHWEGVHYPWHGAICGDIDITGWRKPISHYRNIVWDRGEKLYAAVQMPSPPEGPWQLSQWAFYPTLPSWTWPGHEDKQMVVEVYSRYPQVRLYLENELVGEQATGEAQEFRATFQVSYQPGRLRAVGVEDNQEKEEFELVTTGAPHSIRLTADSRSMTVGLQSLSFVTVEVVDQKGRWCPQADHEVHYQLDGPGTIAAVGSGDLASQETYQDSTRAVFNGRALVVLRGTNEPGTLTLRASAEGLESQEIGIESNSP